MEETYSLWNKSLKPTRHNYLILRVGFKWLYRVKYQKKKKKRKTYIPGATAEFIELASVREDDKSNFSITQNRKFISLLKQTISSLCKRYLSIYFVLDSLQFYSPSPHYYCIYVYIYYIINIIIVTKNILYDQKQQYICTS